MVAEPSASFSALGILLLLGVPACGLLALILGVVALLRIARSGGALRGKGLAVAAVVLGGLMLLATPVILGIAAAWQSSSSWHDQVIIEADVAKQKQPEYDPNKKRDIFKNTKPPEAAPEPGAGSVENPAPQPAPPAQASPTLRLFPGGLSQFLRSCGVCGLLVLLLGAGVLFFILVSLITGRFAWTPLVLGALAGLLGLAGTVLGMVQSFSVISAKGGAANPADLADGISASLSTTFAGLAAFLVGLIGSLILAAINARRSRPVEDAAAAR